METKKDMPSISAGERSEEKRVDESSAPIVATKKQLLAEFH